MDKCFLALETGSKHNEGVFSLSKIEIVKWYLSSKTGLDSKELKSKNSLFQVFARSFSDTHHVQRVSINRMYRSITIFRYPICIYCYFLLTQVFAGNNDRDSIVRHYLNPPIRARYIRFQPIAWNEHISMRVGLNGC